MKFLKSAAVLWCLLALAYALTTVAAHAPGWAKGIDNLVAKAQTAAGSVTEAADTANDVSTEMLDLVGSINVTVDRINGKNGKPGLLDKFDVTIHKVDTILDSTNLVIKQTESTIRNLDAETAESLKHVNNVVDAVAPTLAAAQGTMNESTLFIKGPLTLTLAAVTTDTHGVLYPTGLMVGDFQRKSHEWLYP